MFVLKPIGHVRSQLVDREHAPKQAHEGAPAAWLEFEPEFHEGLRTVQLGEEYLLLTWLHQGDREVLRVHPRDDVTVPQRGVFSTRSQDRPNPIGVHRVRIIELPTPGRIRVAQLEAFDGTPIVDLKPVLDATLEK